jgi:hypothetical protein
MCDILCSKLTHGAPHGLLCGRLACWLVCLCGSEDLSMRYSGKGSAFGVVFVSLVGARAVWRRSILPLHACCWRKPEPYCNTHSTRMCCTCMERCKRGLSKEGMTHKVAVPHALPIARTFLYSWACGCPDTSGRACTTELIELSRQLHIWGVVA